jgi:glucose/arabinose dehydrogenase
MDFHDGDRFPEWRGDLFVGALAARELRRVDLDASGRVLGQESLLKELDKRIRDVKSGPDVHLYVLTDELEGKLLRIVPRNREAP